MKKILFFALSLILATAAFAQQSPKEIEIGSNSIRLKQDLTRGGAICYISLSNEDRNLVNICDDRCIKVYFLPVIYGFFKSATRDAIFSNRTTLASRSIVRMRDSAQRGHPGRGTLSRWAIMPVTVPRYWTLATRAGNPTSSAYRCSGI